MLFSATPKEKEDLYAFEDEINMLLELYMNNLTRLTGIKGLRRTGKSSLLRVSHNMSKLGYILLDLKKFDIRSMKELSKKITQILVETAHGKRKQIKERIKAVSLAGFKIELSKDEQDYKVILRKINNWAERNIFYICH